MLKSLSNRPFLHHSYDSINSLTQRSDIVSTDVATTCCDSLCCLHHFDDCDAEENFFDL